jgi:hypothetical protein
MWHDRPLLPPAPQPTPHLDPDRRLLRLATSTVHAVLRRYRMARLIDPDRATGAGVRRYEHPAPGELVHVDSKEARQHPRRRRAPCCRST